jgi:hypothetical protein
MEIIDLEGYIEFKWETIPIEECIQKKMIYMKDVN